MNKPKMRLVDANTLKAEFTGNFRESYEPSLIKALIDVAPTIDAEPVKHGRWIAVPSSDRATGKAYKCSECDKMRYGSFMPNYCQICGAKMDLEEE